MKITNEQLKQIILEEVQNALLEREPGATLHPQWGGGRVRVPAGEDPSQYRMGDAPVVGAALDGAALVTIGVMTANMATPTATLGASLAGFGVSAAVLGPALVGAAAGEMINRALFGTSLADVGQLKGHIVAAARDMDKKKAWKTVRTGCKELTRQEKKAKQIAKNWETTVKMGGVYDHKAATEELEPYLVPVDRKKDIAAAFIAATKFNPRAYSKNGLFPKCRKAVGFMDKKY